MMNLLLWGTGRDLEEREMDFAGKKVLVVGVGISGIAAAKTAKKLGAEVILNDAKPEEEIKYDLTALKEMGVNFCLGRQSEEILAGIDFVIVSPAVPLAIPLLQAAQQKNIPVLSEVEAAYRLAQAPFYAVTGTNGKTTTVTLLQLLLQQKYKYAGLGGNVGTPLIEEAQRIPAEGCIVAEISSYQMEASSTFTPHVAAVLNVTPDHLARHGSMEVYQQMKEKLFAHQGADDIAVLNYDDERTREMAKRAPGKVCYFSRLHELKEGAYLEGDMLTMSWQGKKYPVCTVDELKIKGGHNVENALAAIAAAYFGGVDAEAMKRVLMSFQGVEHRIEPVRTLAGVEYYNDSKATNPEAAIKALETFSGHIILIAGGFDKKTPLDDYNKLILERVDEYILVGDAAARFKKSIIEAGYDEKHIHEAGYSMEKAVELAHKLAKEPQVVLLSPACSSYDMYDGYEERGRDFKRVVNSLNC